MARSLRSLALSGMMAVALLAVVLPPPAGGDGGGGGGGGPERILAPTKPADPQYSAAVSAIKAGEYAKAIPLLERVVSRDGTNADAYNWLAYATRKNAPRRRPSRFTRRR